jgi:2-amino-4-hydroxy-6-hydroxymethyldihydropteridine diphosphokinase
VTRAVIGLGTNLGARRALLLSAIHALAVRPGLSVLGRSRLYETPPLGPPQPDFLNAAILVECSTDPLSLLSELHFVERLLGRERRERWGPRTIDLDFLWWEKGDVEEPSLSVPHPGLYLRNFALAPLLDLLPAHAEGRSRLAELGGPPRVRPWPVFVRSQEQLVVRDIGDEGDLASLVLSSVLQAAASSKPLLSQPFAFPAGEALLSVRSGLVQAAASGFAASWACATEVDRSGGQRGVYLGESGACSELPSISAIRLERDGESLTAIIHMGQRA